MSDHPGSCIGSFLGLPLLRQQEGGKPSSVPIREEKITEMPSSRPPPRPHNSRAVPCLRLVSHTDPTSTTRDLVGLGTAVFECPGCLVVGARFVRRHISLK